MRVPVIVVLAAVGFVSARSNCQDGGDPAGDVKLAACILEEVAATACIDQACSCRQGAYITSCYSQYCGGYVPTGIAAMQSTACLNSGGGAQIRPILYLGSSPTATPTSASPDSASADSAPAATSLVAVASTATPSATAASAATLPSTTTPAPTAAEPPTNTVSDPPTRTASGTAQPAAASKAAANLGFVAPAGGAITAVIGLLAYL